MTREKVIGWVETNQKKLIPIAAGLALLVILAVLIFAFGSGEPPLRADGYYDLDQKSWPRTEQTRGLPSFSGDIYSVLADKTSTAVFVRNVNREEANEYLKALSSAGVTFTQADGFPRSGQKNKILVAVAHEIDTGHFSVTFTIESVDSQK